MKLISKFVTTLACLLMASSCGIPPPPPSSNFHAELRLRLDYYAELRLGDSGKRQLLLERDDTSGMYSPTDFQNFRHRIACWIDLQGDGPVYAFDAPVNFSPQVGTIKIDDAIKIISIDLSLKRSIDGKHPLYPYNGIYHLAKITHDPFYSPDKNPK